jgi:electron transfer flavoprotein beta subunit
MSPRTSIAIGAATRRSVAVKIVACLRPVREPSDGVSTPEAAMSEFEQGPSRCVLPESEQSVLEQALRMREVMGGSCEVISLAAGQEWLDEGLRVSLAMGADRALRVPMGESDRWDPMQIGALLASAVRQLDADLVLCGERSTSGMHGVVGPAIAHFLGHPLLSRVVQLEFATRSATLLATQRFDKGDRWVWECELPAVCTLDGSINIPRYVPVHRRTLARRRTIPELAPHDASSVADEVVGRFGRLDLVKIAVPRVRPKRIETPSASLSAAERLKAIRSGGVRERKKERQALKGDAPSVARQIVEFLVEKGFV